MTQFEENKKELRQHLRLAVYHLTECWDALGRAEDLVPGEINLEDISPIASEIQFPSEAFSLGRGVIGDGKLVVTDQFNSLVGDLLKRRQRQHKAGRTQRKGGR